MDLYLVNLMDDTCIISESPTQPAGSGVVGPFNSYCDLISTYILKVKSEDRQPFFTNFEEEVFDVADALTQFMLCKVDVRIAYWPWTRNGIEYWNISFGFIDDSGNWGGDILMYCLEYNSRYINEITARFKEEGYQVNGDHIRQADHIPTPEELNEKDEGDPLRSLVDQWFLETNASSPISFGPKEYNPYRWLDAHPNATIAEYEASVDSKFRDDHIDYSQYLEPQLSFWQHIKEVWRILTR